MSLSTGNARQGRYRLYRCSSHPGHKPKHTVTISAALVEDIVVDALKAILADAEGRASAETGARDAELSLDRAQRELEALIDILDPLEPKARERIAARR